jgi:inner membrane protein
MRSVYNEDARSAMSAGKPARQRSSPLTALYRWLASHVARRWVSVILIACILAVDLALPWQGWSFTVRALLDEPCHQATGLICLGAVTRFRGRPPDPRFGWAMLICSNAIDLDHLPLEFGSSVLTAGTPRPYTHALWVVVMLALAVLAVLAARAWSRRAGTRASATTVLVLLGAACGVSDHFLRDIATAQMSLWWPITDAPVEVSYWWYVAAIVVIALIPVTRQRCNDDKVEESADAHSSAYST